MESGELKRALDELARHWRDGQISREEFEAARTLLEAQASTFVNTPHHLQTHKPMPIGRKTAPYPVFRPPAVTEELGTDLDPPTPYHPPMTTSQHTLATPPSTIPSRGPGQTPPTRAVLTQPHHIARDTPLAHGENAARQLETGAAGAPKDSVNVGELEELEELVEALKNLSKLHLAGILTGDEYQSTKEPILLQIRAILRHTLAQRGSTSYPALWAKILAR